MLLFVKLILAYTNKMVEKYVAD